MNMSTLLTASIDKFIPGMKGANLANYVEFQDFMKDKDGKIIGAIVYDRLKKKQFKIKSKVVVNCAGIHADELRKKDNPEAVQRITGARGTHLMFQKDLFKDNTGIIIPKTSDGRLIFVINYLGHTMVGTTDEKCEITHTVDPTEEDTKFIIKELKSVLGEDIDYEKSLVSAWSGIRPLVIETEEDKKIAQQKELEKPSYFLLSTVNRGFKRALISLGQKIHGAPKGSTANLSRNHVIEETPSGLISVMGGKWTSFRKMGEETVDLILKQQGRHMEPTVEGSQTLKFKLIGSYSRIQCTDGLI